MTRLAIKGGVRHAAFPDGTAVSFGKASFFVKNAKLTPAIAAILNALDGTKPVQEVRALMPQAAAPLLEACIRQLEATDMLTTETESDVAAAYPGLAVALMLRQLGPDWRQSTAAWQKLEVIVNETRFTERLAERLRSLGVGSVRIVSPTQLAGQDAAAGVRLRIVEHPDEPVTWPAIPAPISTMLTIAISGNQAAMTWAAPADDDLPGKLYGGLGNKDGLLTRVAEQVLEAQIIFELLLFVAGRAGLDGSQPGGDTVRIIKPDGAISKQPLDIFLAGKSETAVDALDGLESGSTPQPLYARSWFKPDGPLEIVPLDERHAFPLHHCAVRVGSDSGDAEPVVVDWGVNPLEAEHRAIRQAIARVQRHRATGSEREGVEADFAAADSAELALAEAAALALARALTHEDPGHAIESSPVAFQDLEADTQMLARIVLLSTGQSPDMMVAEPFPGRLYVARARADNFLALGIASDSQRALFEAAGELVTMIQLGETGSRQANMVYQALAPRLTLSSPPAGAGLRRVEPAIKSAIVWSDTSGAGGAGAGVYCAMATT